MLSFITRRVVQSLFVLFAMSLIVFTLINLVGDPVDMLVNPESLPEEIERVRKDFGLDQPVHIQYWKFLNGALSGDLGTSFIFGRPALTLIIERFPATFELATCALLIAISFGLPLGIYAGLHPDKIGTKIITGSSILGISIPTFWLGLMLIIVFSVLLGLLPVSGRGDTAIFFGIESAGSKRWISLGFFSIQPSEFAKIFLVLAIAKYYSEVVYIKDHSLIKSIFPILLILVPFLLIANQPDLGTSLLLLTNSK